MLYGTRLDHSYTSYEEVERLLSRDGRKGWTDDLHYGNGNYTDADEIEVQEFYTEIIEDATSTIDQYLQRIYQTSDMERSPWIRRRATYLAAYYLTSRRGDPGLYGGHYERIVSELMMASMGDIQVPDLPFNDTLMPVIQNPVVDMRYVYSHSRIRRETSTATSGRESFMYAFPYDWLF